MLSAARVLAHQTAPLAPDDLWTAWSAHPVALVALALPAAVYARGRSRAAGRERRWRERCAIGALCVLGLALLSPLDALARELASAHMVQHVLLTLVAAPLAALAAPLPVLWRGVPEQLRRRVAGMARRARLPVPLRLRQLPAVAWLLHVAALWIWHGQALYEAALVNPVVHSLEHLSFLGTGLLFWHTVLGRDGRTTAGTGVVLLFTMGLQGGFLSALLTFASTPWYDVYPATRAWGLHPLADQQLAGLVMWVSGGLIYLGFALALVATGLERDQGRLPACTPDEGAATRGGRCPASRSSRHVLGVARAAPPIQDARG